MQKSDKINITICKDKRWNACVYGSNKQNYRMLLALHYIIILP